MASGRVNRIEFLPAMRTLEHGDTGIVGEHYSKISREILFLAQRQVGVKTGRLRASLKVSFSSNPRGMVWEIGSDVGHALLHHEGTRPHVIRPKTAPVLVFKSKGRLYRVSQVMHPGTKPNRYLTTHLYLALK
jgi:hypothetical protein